ncbi:unnamed protein product [Adineta steineri]|uniref:Beta-sarcoglycan n=1 Tax=Adineta steineri TaxID=433720 RepID=A0A818YCP6_9BILA|nr:unnamed protein product [Adineta steineri]CAF3748453.1 unnamed protein product [Adineta steineri]
MGKNRYNNRRHPSVMLDAGYVSIRAIDICTSSKIIGLHGKKLFCVILTVFILFLISFINLTCLIVIMYKLDWTPFHKNGSKVFRFDKINQNIELYNQVTFNEAIYTTKIKDSTQIDLASNDQIDIYGDHNSILFDDDQILMNTEYFHMNHKLLVDFSNLHLFKFDDKKNTKIHLDHTNSQYIYSKELNLTAQNQLTISKVNKVLFSGENLVINTNRHNRRSVIRFDNNPRKLKNSDYRQKSSFGNLNFQSDSLYIDIPRSSYEENPRRIKANVYRICICNTTLLLLQSFAHQPCPLC